MQTGVRGWKKQQYISKDTKQRRKSKAEKALTSKVSTAYAWEGRGKNEKKEGESEGENEGVGMEGSKCVKPPLVYS